MILTTYNVEYYEGDVRVDCVGDIVNIERSHIVVNFYQQCDISLVFFFFFLTKT